MNKLKLFFQFFNKIKKILFLFIALFNLGSIFSYIYFFFKLIGYFKSLGLFSKLNFINNLNNIWMLMRYNVDEDDEEEYWKHHYSDDDDIEKDPTRKRIVENFLKQYQAERPYAYIVLKILMKMDRILWQLWQDYLNDLDEKKKQKKEAANLIYEILITKNDDFIKEDNEIMELFFGKNNGILKKFYGDNDEDTLTKLPKKEEEWIRLVTTKEKFGVWSQQFRSREIKALIKYLIDNNYITIAIILLYYLIVLKKTGENNRNQNEDDNE